MDVELKAQDSIELAQEIGEQIAHLGPDTIGAILADLTAMWVAGHYAASGVKEQTADVRRKVIEAWVKCVNELVNVIDDQMEEDGVSLKDLDETLQ